MIFSFPLTQFQLYFVSGFSLTSNLEFEYEITVHCNEWNMTSLFPFIHPICALINWREHVSYVIGNIFITSVFDFKILMLCEIPEKSLFINSEIYSYWKYMVHNKITIKLFCNVDFVFFLLFNSYISLWVDQGEEFYFSYSLYCAEMEIIWMKTLFYLNLGSGVTFPSCLSWKHNTYILNVCLKIGKL